MIFTPLGLRLSATDLSNHLACHHLTSLNLSVARGERKAPAPHAPDLVVIQEMGFRHEAAYVKSLQQSGLAIEDLRGIESESEATRQTLAHMADGVDVIAQGALAAGRWFGRPDILRKTETRSRLGNWSYEPYDCKLATETKAATLLQLSVYAALLQENQGIAPENVYVVPARRDFQPEKYRFAEYAAYYRYVRRLLEKACENNGAGQTYPEPCELCEVCRWFTECDAVRRGDDHLTYVAGISRQQRNQLDLWQVETMAALAKLPVPLGQKPKHGSKAAYEKVREQARIQVQGRAESRPVHELFPVCPDLGLCNLPEPSASDIFLDIEGDPFAGPDGLQYLFGFVTTNSRGKLVYECKWSLTPQEEKTAFEWLIDQIISRWQSEPATHLYHFGSYEADQLKRLMGRYNTREDEVDRILRAKLMVDLHAILKQSLRASVEAYGLKQLEQFHGYEREIPLRLASSSMRYMQHKLELGWDEPTPQDIQATIEGYNEDDCRSTAALRDWLESQRKILESEGHTLSRRALGDGAPSEKLDEQQRRIAELYSALVADLPVDSSSRTPDQQVRWILAQLLDWHRRENKAGWWEGYRLEALGDEELRDERVAIAGLQFAKRISNERNNLIDRYTFDRQETELRAEKDVYHRGERIGSVEAIDLQSGTIDIKKARKAADTHPASIYMWDSPVNCAHHVESLFRLGEWVRDHPIEAPGKFQAARDLLLKRTPRLANGEEIAPLPGETSVERAVRIAANLDHSILAIQGPPGAGKTFTGARMICDAVRRGKKVGITALSHKVIRKLLEEVVAAAREKGFTGVRCMQKTEEFEATPEIAVANKNEIAWSALRSGEANVLGGTSWLWASAAAHELVDILFIDEAGQMALADVVAVAQAAKNLVLIGDPQQLERPLKGSHSPGAELSALEHLLDGHKTIPQSIGMLLPETYRMHPAICDFTSELFYDSRLTAEHKTRFRTLSGHAWLGGAGLWLVPIAHEGNRNSSPEEVRAVREIVESLLAPGVAWYRSAGNPRPVSLEDILVVAPYNMQVADLQAALPAGTRVGTVDKFQGQEAPVVIYSLTTSSPADAPRGMEFLYSLNRLNVATSRGMSIVIVVGSPKLFEPECHSPRQIQLANALCRFAEMARTHNVKSPDSAPRAQLPLGFT